jgi:acyl-CoA synthetase (AMP-forming)/AMP-acid ligase II
MIDTTPALLRAAAQRWRDKTALISLRDSAVSFATLDVEADRFAKALIGDGVDPEERIGIWAPNMWEWVAAAVGAQRVGAAIVPLNSRYRAAEVADIVRRAKVRRLVAVGDFLGTYYPAMVRGEDMPELKQVIVLRGAASKLAGREISWESFLAGGAGVADTLVREREARVTGETVADILFTSGTTGKPKGAVFTHQCTVRSSYGTQNFASVTDADCLCPMGPFAHFAGYKAGWLNGLLTGATVCWSDAADSESILNVISRLRVTVMPAPPVIWQDILDNPHRGDWNTSSLRFVATGSTMIPPQTVRRLVSEMRIKQVGTGYGLTESGGMTNFTRPDDTVDQVAFSAGRPAPDSEVGIADAQGHWLGPNEVGEILVRTKRLMREYLDDPIATRATIEADGWLHTGDVGSIDEEGYLKITDRLKDMYITNGFNVYPAEIERLLGTMPGVASCAVIGMPEPRKGEVGRAFLIRSPGSTISEAEVLAWCKQNIANYKIPVGITFVDDFPRNSLGKILKRELKRRV